MSLFILCVMVTKHGMTSEAYVKVRKELEPVEKKVPKAFLKSEWKLLPMGEKLEFVRAKKDAVLAAMQSRLSSPVVSLMVDLADLETKMEFQAIKDGDSEEAFSDKYLQAMKLKIDLAKALKYLTDSGIVKHEHIMKKLDENEVIDADWEEVFAKGTEGDGS